MSPVENLPPLRDANALVSAMSKVARALAEDLVERSRDPRVEPSLNASWEREKEDGHTGEPFDLWRRAFCDQVSASWVLATVFVRTLEDRGFLPHRLAGPGAADQLASFRRQFRFLSERDYLLQIFDALAEPPPSWPRERPSSQWVGAQVFGRDAAPLWRLSPSSEALATLLDTLRAQDGDQLRFTFGRPEGVEHDGSTTRFLGDLYQDLNEAVRKRYALLQTPDFVENFILDQTLSPAMKERGIGVTLIDPACGSGHFLLGAFDRLFEARRRKSPGSDRAELAKQALSQVFGVDLNPYAAAIARFRLVVSYLDKAGVSSLDAFPPDLNVNVFVGDALLSGQETQTEFGEVTNDALFGRVRRFSLLDQATHELLRDSRFDVVVGNPPYITEKDAAKRELIRRNYTAAAGKYALSAPFVERLFQLANDGGWSGQITANSFMKREFGKALIQEVLPKLDLSKIIDTSGAYIPGHGTPTVLLFGRNREPVGTEAQIVRGTRGEPSTPDDPAQGQVWSSIAAHHDDEAYEDPFISVGRIDRETLKQHPWSIGGGGAAELKELLESKTDRRLANIATDIGFDSILGEEETYAGPRHWLSHVAESEQTRTLVSGDLVRDWVIATGDDVLFPYSSGLMAQLREMSKPHLWRFRTGLARRQQFGKTTLEAGLEWFEYRSFYKSKRSTPLAITFAFVATHNHFVLDRGGKVFKQSAPIIKLPAGATEEEHLALLGYLNSSVTAFLGRQILYPKGGDQLGDGGRLSRTPWEDRLEWAGTPLQALPVPDDLGTIKELATHLDRKSTEAADLTGLSALQKALKTVTTGTELASALSQIHDSFTHLRHQLVAAQEELDWRVYQLFGFSSVVDDDFDIDSPGYEANARAVEVLLAQTDSTTWFERHKRDPIVEPGLLNLSPKVAALLTARLAAIDASKELQLFEAPEHKRRWEPFDWNAAVADACRSFLLDALEAHLDSHRLDPRPLTARELAHALSSDAKLLAVAEVLHGSPTFDLETLVGELMTAESVPSATSQTYTDAGMEKRRLWETCWDLQRQEDAGKTVQIDVPPKYARTDYQNNSVVWRHRGKLDVPKERFIAYPTATAAPGAKGKAASVFGWAGWTHLEQLQAAIALWQDEWEEHGGKLLPRASREDANAERQAEDSQAREKLMPLLQTLVDLLPWVRQWHNGDGETAEQFELYVREECRKVGVSAEEAHEWRAPVAARGVRAARAPRAARTSRAQAVSEAQVLEAVTQMAAEGMETVEVRVLAERLGVPAARLKEVVDSLVVGGGLVEVGKRPRVVGLG